MMLYYLLKKHVTRYPIGNDIASAFAFFLREGGRRKRYCMLKIPHWSDVQFGNDVSLCNSTFVQREKNLTLVSLIFSDNERP